MKQWSNIARHFALLTQLGLSLLTPLLLCLGICWWLNNRAGFGEWVYIPGFIMGLGSAFMTAYKFYLSVVGHEKKEEKKDKISFNRHT